MAKVRRDAMRVDLKKSQANYLNELVTEAHVRGEHITTTSGSSTSASYVTAGNGSITGSGMSDVAGTVTFGGTWANSDTATITYETAYDVAPNVIIGAIHNVNASGVTLVEVDAISSATTAFTLTASGTCVGSFSYICIEPGA